MMAGAKHSVVQASAMITYTVAAFPFERRDSLLLAVRTLWSAEWPEGIDGYYYWEQCGWVNSDDWSSTADMHQNIAAAVQQYYTSQVRQHSTRFYFPGTNTVFASFVYGTPGHGELSPAENYNLLICARWRMHAEDGSYSYHLHRMPVGDESLIDGVWSDDGFTRQVATLNTFIDDGIWRSSTGSLLDKGELAPLPVPWQLRHGTKRRRSRFWLPV